MRRITLGTVAALVALQMAVGVAFADPEPPEASPPTVSKDATGEYNNTSWTIGKTSIGHWWQPSAGQRPSATA
jgi:hypothetical protein